MIPCYGFEILTYEFLIYGIDLMILVMIKQNFLGRILGCYKDTRVMNGFVSMVAQSITV